MFFNNHTHISSLEQFSTPSYRVCSIDIAKPLEIEYMRQNRDESVLFTAGLHPWSIHEGLHIDILSILKDDTLPIIGIGECGLDKCIASSLEMQQHWFRIQAMLAEQTKLPLIIHCVRAYQEILFMHKEIKPTIPWIIHGFNRNISLAKELLHQGFILSIGSDILQNNTVKEMVCQLPENSFLLETDESRHSITDIYNAVAEIRQCTLSTLQQSVELLRTSIYGTF